MISETVQAVVKALTRNAPMGVAALAPALKMAATRDRYSCLTVFINWTRSAEDRMLVEKAIRKEFAMDGKLPFPRQDDGIHASPNQHAEPNHQRTGRQAGTDEGVNKGASPHPGGKGNGKYAQKFASLA